MNLKLYNAVATQLRGTAMESLALVELYLTDPTMVPDHSSLVEEIIKHTQRLTAHENAMVTLQQYFGPKKAPAAASPPPAPAPVSTAPITEEELRKRSPTFRKSEQQKARRTAKKTTKAAAPKTKASTATSEKD